MRKKISCGTALSVAYICTLQLPLSVMSKCKSLKMRLIYLVFSFGNYFRGKSSLVRGIEALKLGNSIYVLKGCGSECGNC